jgi:hypothetical protein
MNRHFPQKVRQSLPPTHIHFEKDTYNIYSTTSFNLAQKEPSKPEIGEVSRREQPQSKRTKHLTRRTKTKDIEDKKVKQARVSCWEHMLARRSREITYVPRKQRKGGREEGTKGEGERKYATTPKQNAPNEKKSSSNARKTPFPDKPCTKHTPTML